ncbi:MAG: bifunctional UDP-N-acetylmuramoyl-tripeptide:D-alanyl-D-alanine ligase/alanine racemase [Bacteroidales bacterium]|jgi:alanine racemase|nr:bifunctional UDP-N-acetylmuramoyl-tripeptide:D-alanyl-D-alanine ligase/alanine racemase [Bacteroidales bacterium]
MIITLKILSSLVGGRIVGLKYADNPIDNILFDSRRLNNINNTVFFAIKTTNNNGSKYIDDLYNKGIRLFVVDCNDEKSIPFYKDASYLVCDDVISCLQSLAVYRREMFDIPVVAITGSNGKTITKDWIVKLIDSDKKVCCNAKSFNSQIGVPISVYQMNEQTEIGIFEAGISKKDEMKNLQKIIQPTIGIFTNIGDAHQINFASMEEKIEEKLCLFINCKQIIFHDDNLLLATKIKMFCDKNNIELISWGTHEDDTYQTSNLLKEVCIPFNDKASIENALTAYVCCLTLDINKRSLQERIKKLEQLEMRFEIKSGINNSLIVNDSYSCDFKSLEIALDYLNLQNKRDKMVILSDLDNFNANNNNNTPNACIAINEINTLLLNKNIDFLVAIGKDFYNNQDKITLNNKKFYLSVEDFLLDAKRRDYTNKAILIKGARRFNFEKISRYLSSKAHQTVLEINLSAIVDNVRHFRSFLKPETMLMAMVKASSYGCGGYEVAATLEKSNMVNYLTVAFADEGVELRQGGIKLPIMVMTPEEESIEKIKQYNLEPVIHSIKVLERFVNEQINIHIKLDTGMHRLGFEQNDINSLIAIIKTHPNIRIRSIFSHFYGADDESLDEYTLKQLSLFEKMSSQITQAFDYKILRHICNSAGIVRFPQAHYDMVRLGVGMYGIGVNIEEQRHLRFVHRLRTTITQIREIDAGEDVSYSRRFVSKHKTTVGVIPIGYADGLNRHLGNEHCSVWINGEYANIIGNICMDMCMIDLTNIKAKEGDTVIIFGNENPVTKLSSALDTIPYEIFTSVAQRVKRVYFQE